MATTSSSSSSSSTFPKKINRYKLPTTLSLLLLFLFYLFFFTRTPLDPKLELYTDPTPAPILLSPPRSTGVHGKLGDIMKPASSLSDADDNVDENVAVNSELPEHKFNEEEPISLKSGNDDSTSQEREEAFVSADSESQGKLGERNGELISSNEEKVFSELPEHKFKEEPISSKSDVDDGTSQESKEAFVSADFESQDKLGERNGELITSNEEKVSSELPEPEFREESEKKGTLSSSESESESQDDFGERNGEDISSNEEKAVAVSSESVGEKTKGESEDIVGMEKPEDDVGEITDDSNKELTVAISSESEENGVEETASSDTNNGGVIDNAFVENLRKCDIYKGTWVKDEGYPIYKPGSCPYVDDGYDCHGNGRPDSGYTQWRWKPDECDLPRFNATDFLVRLRGKRLMLVGDSMNRNQFESLLCLLREGLADKSRMYETHGYKITKGRGYYIFRFKDYDCTVEFVRSHFLVREGVRINARGNSNPTLSIDRIDKTAARWLRADILVFNTGHWWTHGKTARGKNYYKEGNHIYPHFDAAEAYRRAITTWATWVKKNIRRKKLVFYRGYSSAHFRGGDWDSGGTCNGETEPVVRGAILDSYPQKMTIVEQVLKETQVPVVLLNVTRLTNYRKDGHPSVYGKNVTRLKKVSTRRQDCSHWCLPGVPDAWNELIYTTLVVRQTSSH